MNLEQLAQRLQQQGIEATTIRRNEGGTTNSNVLHVHLRSCFRHSSVRRNGRVYRSRFTTDDKRKHHHRICEHQK